MESTFAPTMESTAVLTTMPTNIKIYPATLQPL
jgi:hypothetical protein